MAYDFQGIVNDVLLELNETELDSESKFNSAVGFHKFVKSAVNWSINYIHKEEDWEWPFNKTAGSVVLTAGQGDATTPITLATAASYDWDSFYLAYDALLDKPSQQKLNPMDLSEYRARYFDRDVNNNNLSTPARGKPNYIIRTQDNKAMVTPIADAAYTLKYEYFAYNTPLSTYTSTTSIPESYRHIIVKGALARCYAFRSDENMYNFTMAEFKDDINAMRRVLIPQEESMKYLGGL